MATKIRLGELLVRAGVLDEVQLKAALAEQQRWGGRLGKLLVEMSFVSEDLLVKALSKQLGIPRATFQTFNVPASILQQIDPNFAQAHALCPEHYDAEKRTLTIATADPTNVQALDEIRFKTGLRIQTTLGGESVVHSMIQRHLRGVAPVNAIEMSDDSAIGGLPEGFVGEASTMPPSNGPSAAYGYASAPNPSQAQHGIPGSMFSDSPYRATAPPQAAPPPSAPPPASTYQAHGAAQPSGAAYELVQRLDLAQKQQQKAIRVMLELLMERGVISREDYLRLFAQR